MSVHSPDPIKTSMLERSINRRGESFISFFNAKLSDKQYEKQRLIQILNFKQKGGTEKGIIGKEEECEWKRIYDNLNSPIKNMVFKDTHCTEKWVNTYCVKVYHDSLSQICISWYFQNRIPHNQTKF